MGIITVDMKKVITLNTKIYEWTNESFIKREVPPSERKKNIYGEEIIWKWGPERLMNEGAALELLAQRTTIPVPRVIWYGKDCNGLVRLEVGRIDGLECGDVEKKCRMPAGRKHNDGGECYKCADIAFRNVDCFITDHVLPQLQQVKDNVTGLNGFVLPPPRIVETHPRPSWKPKTSTEKEYVLCHGDLARHNVMVSPETLEVICIFDWEHAGFFPPELEAPVWRMSHAEYQRMFEDTNRIEEEIRLITE